MPETIDVFVERTQRARIKASIGKVPRRVRFVSEMDESDVVIGALDPDTSDVSSIRRALLDSVPTAIIVDETSRAVAYSVLRVLVPLLRRKFIPLIVTSTAEAARRFLLARRHSAEDKLLADAMVHGNTITVWSCEPRAFRCEASQLSALRDLSDEDLADFRVSSSGSRITWPAHDIDLKLSDFREVCDEDFANRQRQRVAKDLVGHGAAIRALRKEHELRQSDIPGLSERELRRIERGKHSPQIGTLRKLAEAHKMPLNDYLKALASRA